jgi:hypothetical protein
MIFPCGADLSLMLIVASAYLNCACLEMPRCEGVIRGHWSGSIRQLYGDQSRAVPGGEMLGVGTRDVLLLLLHGAKPQQNIQSSEA